MDSFFFFQAEDGIRDLVRSRGLGDVYKRQLILNLLNPYTILGFILGGAVVYWFTGASTQAVTSVSYTHLTLPTSDLV